VRVVRIVGLKIPLLMRSWKGNGRGRGRRREGRDVERRRGRRRMERRRMEREDVLVKLGLVGVWHVLHIRPTSPLRFGFGVEDVADPVSRRRGRRWPGGTGGTEREGAKKEESKNEEVEERTRANVRFSSQTNRQM
jgi:hypothetical protein